MKQWNFWQNVVFVIVLLCYLICADVIANLILPPIY